MQLKTHTGVREEAARWFARLHAHDCSESDRAAFRCWHGQHRRNREAYERIEGVSQRIDSLAADARLQALAEEAFLTAQFEADKPTSAWQVPVALAASVALAAATLLYVGGGAELFDTAVVYESADKGSTVTLEDGTRVQLDVNTRIAVNLRPSDRQVRLLAGRAMFDVAPDKSRPFAVETDSARTTALGTRFQVQKGDGEIIVTLEEGVVAIEGTGNKDFYERLQPGEQLSLSAGASEHQKRFVDVQAATGWTRGRLVFQGTPLIEAINEVNRYSEIKVRVGDPTIARLPVGGNFLVGDSGSVVAALVEALPLRAVRDEHEILLFRRYVTDGVAEHPRSTP